jgi:hypothetical protein
VLHAAVCGDIGHWGRRQPHAARGRKPGWSNAAGEETEGGRGTRLNLNAQCAKTGRIQS